MSEWTTLSVTQSTVDHLKEAKPEDMSWNEFLYGVAEDGTIGTTGEAQPTGVDADLHADIETIVKTMKTIEERTGRIDRMIEQMGGQR